MKFSLPQTLISSDKYIEKITGLSLSGTFEQAGPFVYPDSSVKAESMEERAKLWEVQPYVHSEFLSQPLKIKKISDAEQDGYVLSPLSGVLFLKDEKIYLYTSYPKYSRSKWWPFPAPLNHIYDKLQEHQHIRPFPGLFEIEVEGVTDFKGRIKPFIEKSLAFNFFENFKNHKHISNKRKEALIKDLDNALPDEAVQEIRNLYNSTKDSSDKDLQNFFADYIASNIIFNDTDGYGGNQKHNPTLYRDFDALVTAVTNYDHHIGMRVPVSAPLFKMNTNEIVSISTKDWRCYAHPFKPMAILKNKDTNPDPESPSLSTTSSDYSGLYLRRDLPSTLPSQSKISSGSYNNYLNKLKSEHGGFTSQQPSVINGWEAYTEKRLYIESIISDDNAIEITEESKVVLIKGTDVYEVELDPFEKWSLFLSNPRTILAHWYTSGFLHDSYRDLNVSLDIIAQRYASDMAYVPEGSTDPIAFHQVIDDEDIYLHQPYAYYNNVRKDSIPRSIFKSIQSSTPTMPENFTLHPPKNYGYITRSLSSGWWFDAQRAGEAIGEHIKTLDYDMSKHRIYISETYDTPLAKDEMTRSALRAYTGTGSAEHPGKFYAGNLGGYGIEEYVVRVPFTEIPNMLVSQDLVTTFSNTATNNEYIGINLLKNIELLKAKMIIARTYHLGRSISLEANGSDPSSFTYDSKEVRIPATKNWQVMSLGHYNTAVRQHYNISGIQPSELVRLILEEVMYETWGEILLHKGVVVEAIFKGDENKTKAGVRGDSSGSKEVQRRQHNALRRVFTPANHADTAAGAGYGQYGGEILAKKGHLSAHQIVHWYYYGCHVIRAWGHGDCVSRFPDPKQGVQNPDSETAYDWLAWNGATKIPLPSLDVYTDSDEIWKLHDPSGEVRYDNVSAGDFRTSGEAWGLGRKSTAFDANNMDDVYVTTSNSQLVEALYVSRKLISALNKLALKMKPEEGLVIASNNHMREFDVKINGTATKVDRFINQLSEPPGNALVHALRIIQNGNKKIISDDILNSLNLQSFEIKEVNGTKMLVTKGAKARVIYQNSSKEISEDFLDTIFGTNTKDFTYWVKLQNLYSYKEYSEYYYIVQVE